MTKVSKPINVKDIVSENIVECFSLDDTGTIYCKIYLYSTISFTLKAQNNIYKTGKHQFEKRENKNELWYFL